MSVAAGDDVLTVSGGGSTMVWTDELAALSSSLRRVAGEAGEWRHGIDTASWLGGGDDLHDMARRASRVAEEAGRLAEALELAAERYGWAERTVASAAEQAGSVIGWLGGLWASIAVPGALLIALPAALAASGLVIDLALAAAMVLGAARLIGIRPEIDPEPLLRALASDPITIGAVRVLISSVDDAAGGAAHLPYPIVQALGDAGAGLLGANTSAAGTLVIGGLFGVFGESQVRVSRTRAATAMPPESVSELLARIPPARNDAPQIRVDRFGDAENPQWVVYIAGTVTAGIHGGSEPFDITSDVQAVANADPGSYRAVRDALDDAGVRQGDRVTAVGHSQGALLAARLEADPDFRGTGLVTAGGPIAEIDVPADVPELRLEHDDDIIPALSGIDQPDDSPNHLLVSRPYLPSHPDATGIIPAHEITGYRETAAMIDQSPDPRLAQLGAAILAPIGAAAAAAPAAGTTGWWRGERISSDRGGGGGR